MSADSIAKKKLRNAMSFDLTLSLRLINELFTLKQ